MKIKATLAATAMVAAGMMTNPAPAQAQAEPLLGQLMLFGGNFCPRGWFNAEGALLPISQNQALFSLLGTQYGGDGRTTFALPDLRGRAPISVGTGPGLPTYQQGQRGGSTQFTLTQNEMPSHSHSGTVQATTAAADTNRPQRNSFAVTAAGTNIYNDQGGTTNAMAANTLRITNTGGNLPVNKVSPFLAMKWCIASQGVFPSRN